jgi:cytochrome P460
VHDALLSQSQRKPTLATAQWWPDDSWTEATVWRQVQFCGHSIPPDVTTREVASIRKESNFLRRILTEETTMHRASTRALCRIGIRIAIPVCMVCVTNSTAQSGDARQGQAKSDRSPIYGVTVPPGYRDWRLISVKQLTGAEGKFKQMRAQLGNDIAIKAFREGTLPFPDGAVIAALHWNEESSDADNKVLATGFPGLGLESFFAGSAVNVQFMVKDSKRYPASGGWGFGDFTNGIPGDEALHAACFACHEPAKDRDFVFTRYAPTP